MNGSELLKSINAEKARRNGENVSEFEGEFIEADDDDEELLCNAESVISTQSVMSYLPEGITSARAVLLRSKNRVVGYRIKTNKGQFDISSSVAEQLGFNQFKVTTAIELYSHNGLLRSKGEMKSGVLVRDISNNLADCKKLLSVLLK